MCFSKAFALELDSLKVTEAENGKTHEINLTPNTEKLEGCSIGDTDMSRVEQILYLLDTFCVSDEFYHELTLIKQCRINLNKHCHVTSTCTPGEFEDA